MASEGVRPSIRATSLLDSWDQGSGKWSVIRCIIDVEIDDAAPVRLEY